MISRSGFLCVLMFACACAEPPASTHKAIGGDVVARVADVTIPTSLVANVARAQHRSPSDALQLLLNDALLSEGARSKKIDETPAAARDLIALRARLVADRARDEAHAAGPCTDAEVDKLSAIHLKDVELPERVQVIHAIAIRPKKQAENPDRAIQHAREIADAIEVAVHGAPSVEEFEVRAKSVAHDGVDVRVESLPAFGEDGTVPETGGGMDATFAHAAFALASPGDVSNVVETQFGWHIIRLNERLPAKNVPREERRTMFAEECATGRARASIEALLASRRVASRVEIARDANESMTAVIARFNSP